MPLFTFLYTTHNLPLSPLLSHSLLRHPHSLSLSLSLSLQSSLSGLPVSRRGSPILLLLSKIYPGGCNFVITAGGGPSSTLAPSKQRHIRGPQVKSNPWSFVFAFIKLFKLGTKRCRQLLLISCQLSRVLVVSAQTHAQWRRDSSSCRGGSLSLNDGTRALTQCWFDLREEQTQWQDRSTGHPLELPAERSPGNTKSTRARACAHMFWRSGPGPSSRPLWKVTEGPGRKIIVQPEVWSQSTSSVCVCVPPLLPAQPVCTFHPRCDRLARFLKCIVTCHSSTGPGWWHFRYWPPLRLRKKWRAPIGVSWWHERGGPCVSPRQMFCCPRAKAFPPVMQHRPELLRHRIPAPSLPGCVLRFTLCFSFAPVRLFFPPLSSHGYRLRREEKRGHTRTQFVSQENKNQHGETVDAEVSWGSSEAQCTVITLHTLDPDLLSSLYTFVKRTDGNLSELHEKFYKSFLPLLPTRLQSRGLVKTHLFLKGKPVLARL